VPAQRIRLRRRHPDPVPRSQRAAAGRRRSRRRNAGLHGAGHRPGELQLPPEQHDAEPLLHGHGRGHEAHGHDRKIAGVHPMSATTERAKGGATMKTRGSGTDRRNGGGPEDGMALVMALMVLLVLTVIGAALM